MPLQLIAVEGEGPCLCGAIPVRERSPFDLEGNGSFRYINGVAAEVATHAQRSVSVFIGRTVEFVAPSELYAVFTEDLYCVSSICPKYQDALRARPICVNMGTVRQEIVRRSKCPDSH